MPDREELIDHGSDLAFEAFEPHICRETDKFRQPGFSIARRELEETLRDEKFDKEEISQSIALGAALVIELVRQERIIATQEECRVKSPEAVHSARGRAEDTGNLAGEDFRGVSKGQSTQSANESAGEPPSNATTTPDVLSLQERSPGFGEVQFTTALYGAMQFVGKVAAAGVAVRFVGNRIIRKRQHGQQA